MMNVSSMEGSCGPVSTTGAARVGRNESRGTQESTNGAPVQRGEDRVELSEASRLLAKLQGLPEIRQDLVDRVRAEIEAGTYETPERVDSAIEAMLSELEEGI